MSAKLIEQPSVVVLGGPNIDILRVGGSDDVEKRGLQAKVMVFGRVWGAVPNNSLDDGSKLLLGKQRSPGTLQQTKAKVGILGTRRSRNASDILVGDGADECAPLAATVEEEASPKAATKCK